MTNDEIDEMMDSAVKEVIDLMDKHGDDTVFVIEHTNGDTTTGTGEEVIGAIEQLRRDLQNNNPAENYDRAMRGVGLP